MLNILLTQFKLKPQENPDISLGVAKGMHTYDYQEDYVTLEKY